MKPIKLINRSIFKKKIQFKKIGDIHQAYSNLRKLKDSKNSKNPKISEKKLKCEKNQATVIQGITVAKQIKRKKLKIRIKLIKRKSVKNENSKKGSNYSSPKIQKNFQGYCRYLQ